MKYRILVCLTIGVAPLLAACANPSQPLTTEPVGPVPSINSQSTRESASVGYLRVYTAREEVGDGYHDFRPYADYTILSSDGRVFRKVVNSVAYQSVGPANVELPTGTYTVVGEGEFYSSVQIPLVIKSGQVTLVHLDGGWTRPVANARARDLVKLPNGEVVGWRAATAN